MDIRKIFNKIEEPKKYLQSGKYKYFDSYRKMLLPITPEERVRQKITKYFEDYMNVPHKCICTEVHLHHYDNVKENGRIDIVIDTIDESGTNLTIAIAECKAEHIPITTQAVEQAFRYADAICCDYVIVTNGVDIYQYLYDGDSKCYKLLSQIVDYTGMLNHCGITADTKNTFKRLTMEQLFGDIDKIREYGYQYNFIGEDTPQELLPYIANMSDALVDCSHALSYLSNETFELVNDLGVSYLGYGDASGSNFGTGEYRSFLINDFKKGHRIVNIGILATSKTVNDSRYGNRDGQSVLITSIRDGEKDEMVAQINLNKFMTIKNDCIYLTHNGAVTRKGASAAELRQNIYNIDNDMIQGNKIFLGSCSAENLLYVDNPDFSNLIARIIKYTILRDEYKSSFSSKQEQRT